ncbi:MAG: DNA primase [Parcubacteria group bacterium Gr01-1014_66]|nr:MAG: DNA primase [Parcubacteria group bacterium Gr01-1014_66]
MHIFRLGFAPARWDFVVSSLVQKGFQKEEIAQAGLAIRGQDGSSWYDRFRGRIMFPISDAAGHVVGFGGRILPEIAEEQERRQDGHQEAKYINTPQTPIYDKSRVLYGFAQAKQHIRINGAAIVVEGYMDCVMSHQAGVLHTVAVSGTALSIPQLTFLKRLTPLLIFAFDTDDAGESATRRSLELASSQELNRKIILIPSGKDPADTIKENPGAWLDAVKKAEDVVSFYFAKAFFRYNPETPEGKKQIASLLLPFLGALDDEIEKAHWVSVCAGKLRVPEEAVWKAVRTQEKKEMSKKEGEMFPIMTRARSFSESERQNLLEERLLSLLLVLPKEKTDMVLEGKTIIFENPVFASLFRRHRLGIDSEEQSSDDTGTSRGVLALKGEIVRDHAENPEEEFVVCVRELEKMQLRKALYVLRNAIVSKEATGEEEAARIMLAEFQTLSQRFRALTRVHTPNPAA